MAQGPPAQPGDLAQAEQRYLRLVEQGPANAEAWLQLGLISIRKGQPAEAIERLRNAAVAGPHQVAAHHHLAICHQALGQRDRAIQEFHQVVCLKPEAPEPYNNWGIALAQGGRPQEAAAAFAQAVRIKPELPEAYNNWGNTLVEQGHLEQAVERFRQALARSPSYPEAQNNLGLALSRLGRPDEAIASFREAVRQRPDYADAHRNLANLCRDRDRLDDAIAAYREAVRLQPGHTEAQIHLAAALARQGKADEAITGLHDAILFQPEAPDLFNQLGVLLAQRDRLDKAVAAFGRALHYRADFAEALNNLGNVLLRQQKADEATSKFHRALELRSDYPQPHCNLASALLQQGKADEAVAHYREALRLSPGYVDAHFNLGNAYRALGRSDDAAGCYSEALRLQPEHAGARLNLGVALSEQGRLDEASAVMEDCLRRNADFASGHNTLGVTRLHQGRPHDALACFAEGIRLEPENPDIRINRALALLQLGDYERGWVEYEWRWKSKKVTPSPYPQPTWDGAPLPNGTIVLRAEQGLGDTIQFVRFASTVKERVGTVLLDCPASLRGLFATCPGIDGLVGTGAPPPAPDVQAPLMSLPRILGTTTATVPATVPYLFADGVLREQWRQRIGPGKGLKVGIVWAGNPQYAGDRLRSVALARFRPLAEVPGVRLFSLQKGKGSEQLAPLAEEMRIADLGAHIGADFRDTAAAIAGLDLVVAVDTAVGHLAGALGAPFWALLPFNSDWRWLLDREDSAWYPSARLFRQPRWGDWDSVFARVAEALRELALRPPEPRATIEVGLAELVERAVAEEQRQEQRQGSAEACWAALRRAGAATDAELARRADRLRAANEALAQVDADMVALAAAPEINGQAAELIRRYVLAREERAGALEQVSAWLSEGALG